MKGIIHSPFIVITVFVIPLLILYGCSSTATKQPSELATHATQEGGSSFQTSLTANEAGVWLYSGANSEKELDKLETVNITGGDRVRLGEGGRGVLRFQDRLEVDLFGMTEINLIAVGESVSIGSFLISLDLVYGNVHLHMNEQAIGKVTLKTDDTSITTLEPGTDFIVSHEPGKPTDVMVQIGAIELEDTSQGQKLILRAGEAN